MVGVFDEMVDSAEPTHSSARTRQAEGTIRGITSRQGRMGWVKGSVTTATHFSHKARLISAPAPFLFRFSGGEAMRGFAKFLRCKERLTTGIVRNCFHCTGNYVGRDSDSVARAIKACSTSFR